MVPKKRDRTNIALAIIILSYILLKIIYGSDRFIVAMGSKDINKFTKDQQVDLIEYLIQVIQIKLVNLS